MQKRAGRPPNSGGQETAIRSNSKLVDVPGWGKVYVKYGIGCHKYDNCFTCPIPFEKCTGGGGKRNK